MVNTLKVAISLSRKDFEKLEKIRKSLGVSRSFLIQKAISFWLKEREKEKLIKQYQRGYQRYPEKIEEIEAYQKAAAEGFEGGEWK